MIVIEVISDGVVAPPTCVGNIVLVVLAETFAAAPVASSSIAAFVLAPVRYGATAAGMPRPILFSVLLEMVQVPKVFWPTDMASPWLLLIEFPVMFMPLEKSTAVP